MQPRFARDAAAKRHCGYRVRVVHLRGPAPRNGFSWLLHQSTEPVAHRRRRGRFRPPARRLLLWPKPSRRQR